MCLASCHILISKQDSTIRALRLNRCVTGRRSHDENHVARFRQSAENCSWARDTQPTRGISDKLARGCKHWHPLAPGRRYGKKSSLIHHRNINPFENKVWEIYILIKKCVRLFIGVRKLWLIMFLLVYIYVAIQHYQKWWMIEIDGERELGKSVCASWHDDDDDDDYWINI